MSIVRLGRCGSGAGGLGGGDRFGDAEEGGVHAGVDSDGGMENLGDGGDPSDEAGAGARDVAVGVQSVDLPIAHGGDGLPLGRKSQREILIARLLLGIAAGSDEENIGGGSENFIEGDAEGGNFRFAEEINAASVSNHLWNPMTAHIERLQPFQKNDAWPVDDETNLQFDFAEFCADSLDYRIRARQTIGFLPHE